MSRKRIFDRVFDKSNVIPPRKKVKRESSRALDDSAERAAEEKLMLLGATRHDKDFQPRYHRREISKLTTDSLSFRTRKNGGRNRWRMRRPRLQRIMGRSLPVCLIMPNPWKGRSLSRRWTQYRRNTRSRHSPLNSPSRSPIHHNPVSRKSRTELCQICPSKCRHRSPCSNLLHQHNSLRDQHAEYPYPESGPKINSFNAYSKPRQRWLVNCNLPAHPQTPRLPCPPPRKFPSKDYPLPRAICLARLASQGRLNLSLKNLLPSQMVKS
jgi:hypothetical protein